MTVEADAEEVKGFAFEPVGAWIKGSEAWQGRGGIVVSVDGHAEVFVGGGVVKMTNDTEARVGLDAPVTACEVGKHVESHLVA